MSAAAIRAMGRVLARAVLIGLAACSASCAKRAAPGALGADPAVRGGNDGLEVRWWLSDDAEGAVGRVLAGYPAAAPGVMSPALGARWELNGFRAVRVPIGDLAALQRRLAPIGALQTVWLGWAREWTEVLRGRRVGAERPVLVNAQPRTLAPGTLRFIARSWTSPGAGAVAERGSPGGGVLRLELAVQLHEQWKIDAERDPFGPPVLEPTEAQGEVFRDVTWNAALGPEEVIVVTAERPRVRWTPSGMHGSDAVAAGEASAETPAGSNSEGASDLFGPPADPPLTLGEAMLTAPAGGPRRGPVKAVVVVVPRVR